MGQKALLNAIFCSYIDASHVPALGCAVCCSIKRVVGSNGVLIKRSLEVYWETSLASCAYEDNCWRS